MAPSGPSSPAQRAFPRLNRPVALGASIAVHAALLLGLSLVHWRVEPEGRASREPPSVVWLRDWAPPTPPPAEPEPLDAPVEPPPPPEDETPAEPPPPAEPAAEAPSPPAPPPEEAPPEEPAEPATPPRREIDWEAERRRAIEQLREQRAREGEVYTFSSEEMPDAVPPEETEPERPSVFDRPSASGRSVLRPSGQARTRVGRAVSEACEALLGGGGLFGISLCGGEGEDVDFFPYIKPLNATGRPECHEVPGAVHPPSLDADPDEPVVKCRIVVDPELLAEREATRPDNVAVSSPPGTPR
ncbi:MAG TPA: hypothetical protein VF322_11325 [Gammaproteobacteria bacterium]